MDADTFQRQSLHDLHLSALRRMHDGAQASSTETPTPTPLAVKTAEMRAERMARRTAKEQEAYRQGYLAGAQASGRSWRKMLAATGRSLQREEEPESL